METKKKYFTRSAFIWSFAVVFILASCSDGDDEKFSINKNKLTLHYEETEQLTASESAEWISENDFVAGVSSDGLVEGGHVGKTNIVATSTAGGSAVCEVEITPVYSTYIEPFLEFGASKETVKSKETRDLYKEESTSLIFEGENSLVRLVLYSFDDSGKLKDAGVVLSLACASEATKFLIERYLPIGENDGVYVFINGNSKNYTMGVGLSVQKSFILITYVPLSSTSSKSSNRDYVREELKSLLDKALEGKNI